MTLDLLRWGGDRMRVGPWRGDQQVAYVSPLPDSPSPSVELVRRCCAHLADQGFREVVTAALGAGEARGFILAGFTVREHLHLLAHDLFDVPAPTIALRRGRRIDREPALVVDGEAFEPFWRLDESGLDEAITATPHSRFRVAELDDQVVGYAVSGRAGRRGFVQRLAVAPAHQGQGRGAALVNDGLRWMKRRGVDRAVVNTQEHNAAALDLYLRLGFRLQPGGLAVLHLPLP